MRSCSRASVTSRLTDSPPIRLPLLVVERHGLHAVGDLAVGRVDVERLRLAGERGPVARRDLGVLLGRHRLRERHAGVGRGVEPAARELRALGDDDPQVGVEHRHDRVGEVGDQRAVARVEQRLLDARGDVLARDVEQPLVRGVDRVEEHPGVARRRWSASGPRARAARSAPRRAPPGPRARARGRRGAAARGRASPASSAAPTPEQVLPRRVGPHEAALEVERAHQVVRQRDEPAGAGGRLLVPRLTHRSGERYEVLSSAVGCSHQRDSGSAQRCSIRPSRHTATATAHVSANSPATT